MMFDLVFTHHSDEQIHELAQAHDKHVIYKAVSKVLGYMETDLRHPSLHTHKYDAITGPHGEDVFESYAQNRTPAAYRIFWHYGPDKNNLTILDISPHP